MTNIMASFCLQRGRELLDGGQKNMQKKEVNQQTQMNPNSLVKTTKLNKYKITNSNY